MDAIASADEAHRDHGAATFLVPDELHRELIEDVPLAGGQWWTSRARLDAAVPDGIVENALAGLAARATRTTPDSPAAEVAPMAMEESERYGEVVSLAAAREARGRARVAAEEAVTRLAAASTATLWPELPREPAVWLSDPTLAPPAGCVPLMLVDEAHDLGVVAELRIRPAELAEGTETWDGAPMLQAIGREAIRRAYEAAGRCTPSQIAPLPFDAHRFELVRPAEFAGRFSVDGRSIGLSAALAFLSAWSDTPMAPDIVPLGTVKADGALDSVGAIATKAAAAREVGERELRFLISEVDRQALSGGDLAVVEGATLRELAPAAGLDPAAVTVGDATPVRARLEALHRLVAVVRSNDLAELGTLAHWEDLAHRMADLLARIPEAHAAKVAEARAMAALAFVHAGHWPQALALLAEVDRARQSPLAQALSDLVALSAAIDGRGDEGALAARLESEVRALGPELDAIRGMALGTVGRYYLHRRELERAMPLLAEAIAIHQRTDPYEVPRSRMYYAMALRMQGEPEEATGELWRGFAELETITRAYDPAYEASTRVFMEYELARCLVALDRYRDALGPATRALEACHGPWPKLGLLRTRAWAHRMLGEEQLAERDVEAMRTLSLGPEMQWLVDDLLEEAEGYPVDDGVVY